MGKVRKRKNTYTSGKRYLCGTASLQSYPVCGQMVKGLDVPPGLSGWLWMLLGEKRPAAAALHSEPGSHVGLQATGLQEGGREERGESWLG